MDFTPSIPLFPPPILAPAQISDVDEERNKALEKVQSIIGYSFRNLSLLEEALTHSSNVSHASYQRLEFVGDAVLSLAFTNFVFLTNPSVGPGVLSFLRAANVSNEKLARVAVRHDFYRYLRCKPTNLDIKVREFAEAVSKEREGYGDPFYARSTVKAPKVLADIVESIAAAIYVDCSFNLVEFWKVFRGILEPIITAETPNQQSVTHLYRLCQKQGMLPMFKNWKKKNINITNVFIGGELCGIGSSEQKHIAKLNAARDALQKLGHDKTDHIEIAKCSQSSSGTLEGQEASGKVNGELVISRTTHANGGKEVDCLNQRLHLLCWKKCRPKPVLRNKKRPLPQQEGKKKKINILAPQRQKKKNQCNPVKCYCCRKTGHKTNVCRKKAVICFKCGQKGHFSIKCPNSCTTHKAYCLLTLLTPFVGSGPSSGMNQPQQCNGTPS